MAAIVRVKRRRNEDPADSLLLACKRHRSSQLNEQSDSSHQVDNVKGFFKFAGTVVEQLGSVSGQIRDAIRKEKLQKEYKHHNSYAGLDVTRNARKEVKAKACSSRYKVISKKRALQLEELDTEITGTEGERRLSDEGTGEKGNETKVDGTEHQDDDSKIFHLYDVIHDEPKVPPAQAGCAEPKDVISCNGVPLVREKVPPPSSEAGPSKNDFVYDLYYLNSRDFDYRALENIVSIEAFNGGVEFGDYRVQEEEEVYDDEDDSNDEDNWRNDYPDEDPMFFENEDVAYDYSCGQEGTFDIDDHLSAMKHVTIVDDDDDEGDLSSDDEDHVYFNEPLHAQVWSPRTSYDKYKACVLKELGPDGKEDSDDDEES